MHTDFFLFLVVGFAAQIVDGALGMAYGVISTSFLLSFGIPPAISSASVHTAEVFTTGISGLSHAYFKNIDRALCIRLIIPGVIGSILGAYVLTRLPVQLIKPYIGLYLLALGLLIVLKAFQAKRPLHQIRSYRLLGFTGGFLDAAGGGGWGPMVTSTLVAQGTDPRYAIGSTNLAEFLITLSSSITFFILIGITHWYIVAGLITGGVIAAPLAAILTRHIQRKFLMVLVGLLVISTSTYNIWRSLLT